MMMKIMMMIMMKFKQDLDWKHQEGIVYLKNPEVDGKTILNWTL
jgi:hypothetical protein